MIVPNSKQLWSLLVYFLTDILTIWGVAESVGSDGVGVRPVGNNGHRSVATYTIEGKVFPSPNSSITAEWFTDTKVIVNYGQYLAFMRFVYLHFSSFGFDCLIRLMNTFITLQERRQL